jgi:ABC-type transporter Mla maintaining outer membrane lipid asymmetry ATPase subunit MlaF
MGLEKPDAGQILINGREICRLGESDLLAIRGGLMGMVFQEESLFTGLFVHDNVAYRLDEHGWSEEDIDKAVNQVLKFVGFLARSTKWRQRKFQKRTGSGFSTCLAGSTKAG